MRVRLYYQFPFKMNSNTCHQYVGVKKTLKTGFSNLHAMQLARAPQQKLNLVLCMLQDFIGMDYLLFCSPVKFHSRMHFCRWFFFFTSMEKNISCQRKGEVNFLWGKIYCSASHTRPRRLSTMKRKWEALLRSLKLREREREIENSESLTMKVIAFLLSDGALPKIDGSWGPFFIFSKLYKENYFPRKICLE